MSAEPVCQFYKYGYCKFGDRCRRLHNHTICKADNCTSYQCSFRHPKACRFFQKYGQCKFGSYCQFGHVQHMPNDRDKNSSSMEELMEKFNKLIDQKVAEVFKTLNDGITKVAIIASQLEKSLGNLKPDVPPKPVHDASTAATENVLNGTRYPNTSARIDVAPSSRSMFTLPQPQPFQTQPGTSCCNHVCRPDPGEDNDICCRHRCRNPWP